MVKIQKTNQNEKFLKMQRIQKFEKYGTTTKMHKPELPKDPAKRKESQKNKNENQTKPQVSDSKYKNSRTP